MDKCAVITADHLKFPKSSVTKPDLNFRGTIGTHEEADTRLVLHSAHTHSPTVAPDTDDILKLIAHCTTKNKQICMKAGISKKPKFISYQ